MSVVVQFRVPEEEIEQLRKRRIHPNEFAREAFEGRLRWLRALETTEFIRKSGVRLTKPAHEIIREDRDSH